ncbi:MAG: hypothetical protein HEP71_15945 [Roseivirga sp.]|nr:hypothetical protein [Roseivirga sp.]
MSNNQTQEQSGIDAHPSLVLAHPMLKELSITAAQVRTAKNHERLITVFQFPEALNHFVAIPHETLVHNLDQTISSLGNSADAMAWSWVWPWDIARFAVSAPKDFLREVGRFPHLAKGLIDSLNTGHTSSENLNKVRGLASFDKMREFFSGLGQHQEFKTLYPNAAKLCRVAGGEDAGGPLAAPENIGSSNEKVMKFIVEVLIAIGVISGAIGAAAATVLGIVLGVIGLVVGASAIIVGAAAIALVICAVAVIVIVLLGLAITIVATIAALIIGGILIFNTSGTDDIDEYVTGELALQLV